MIAESWWIGFVVVACLVIGWLAARDFYLRHMRSLVAREVSGMRAALERECERTAEWNFRAGREKGANEMADKAVRVGLRLN